MRPKRLSGQTNTKRMVYGNQEYQRNSKTLCLSWFCNGIYNCCLPVSWHLFGLYLVILYYVYYFVCVFAFFLCVPEERSFYDIGIVIPWVLFGAHFVGVCFFVVVVLFLIAVVVWSRSVVGASHWAMPHYLFPRFVTILFYAPQIFRNGQNKQTWKRNVYYECETSILDLMFIQNELHTVMADKKCAPMMDYSLWFIVSVQLTHTHIYTTNINDMSVQVTTSYLF